MNKTIMLLLTVVFVVMLGLFAKAETTFVDVGLNRSYTSIKSPTMPAYDTSSGFVAVGYGIERKYLNYNVKGLYTRSSHNDNVTAQVNAEYMFLESVGFQAGLNLNHPIKTRDYFPMSSIGYKLGSQLEVNYRHNPEISFFVSQQDLSNNVKSSKLVQKNHLLGIRYNF